MFPKRLVPLSRRPSLTDLDSAIYFSESEIFEHISHQQTTKYLKKQHETEKEIRF
jgi:hypothetical protein